MTLGEVKTILDAQLLCGEELLEQEVHTACGLLFQSGLNGGVHIQ